MTPITWATVIWILVGTIGLSLVRVAIGPTLADRLVGLNLVAAQVLVILVVFAVRERLSFYLDVALVYSIFGFLGILAIARFFSRVRRRQ